MLEPPVLRGGAGARLLALIVGLFLCACGIVAFLESELGLPPWDVLHQGLAEQTRLSFGAANLVVSAAVLVLAWALRARIGLGTVLNAALVGTFVIGLLALEPVHDLSESGIAGRIGLMVCALAAFGIGSALYIGADLGAGPRDSLMLVSSLRLRVRIGVSRGVLEVAALGVGFAMGGTFGVGTVVFALGIGPAVELSFRLLQRTPLAVPAVASPA